MNNMGIAFLFKLFIFGLCQDFGYPELPGQRLDSENKNASERVPLYVPGKCPENQLLYPGDRPTDWICDCSAGFLYYPPRDGCFAAYRKGPCQNNEYLVLKKGEVIPECIRNSCQDGFVKYNNKCYELNKPNGPCRPINEGGGIFGVNTTTLAIECLKGTDLLSLIKVPENCPPGSRRDTTNRCRQKIEK